ncbi:ISAs1 family transposase [Arthrobacter psychrochitiniphilus]|uniref:ISAs1 family transposase n=1 Tax=Arthrobacter psychrochitiniphilus TaxID=291045 RepID=UPI003F7BAC66
MVPRSTTFSRVLQRLDADTLDRLAGSWAQGMTAVTAIAIDGKEVRGAKNGGGTRVHLLAGVDHATGAVLVQENVSEKHNEITYFKHLLEGIKDIGGVIATAVALHTQREHADYLHSRSAHYVLPVKANQPKHHDQLRALPWKRSVPETRVRRLPTAARSNGPSNALASLPGSSFRTPPRPPRSPENPGPSEPGNGQPRRSTSSRHERQHKENQNS